MNISIIEKAKKNSSLLAMNLFFEKTTNFRTLVQPYTHRPHIKVICDETAKNTRIVL